MIYMFIYVTFIFVVPVKFLSSKTTKKPTITPKKLKEFKPDSKPVYDVASEKIPEFSEGYKVIKQEIFVVLYVFEYVFFLLSFHMNYCF